MQLHHVGAAVYATKRFRSGVLPPRPDQGSSSSDLHLKACSLQAICMVLDRRSRTPCEGDQVPHTFPALLADGI
jgi:hypothetical protein